ncbi:MAG: alginate export family protein [Nitrospiraceae bacterium]|nr:alginate export family protein [Nitrospiraceae bacterium]
MRKALKVATLMGMAAALIAPSVSAQDMSMGSTKVTVGGQLRERLNWDANEAGSGKGKEVNIPIRARLKVGAQLSNGVSAVFVPEWNYNAGAGANGVLNMNTGKVSMHEAYMLLANPFGINNVIVKAGRQEVNLGNGRMIGTANWGAGRSLDGVLLGYAAGKYGLLGGFYGKLNDATQGDPRLPDTDVYVGTWQGNFKGFNVANLGGSYIYINPTVKDFDLNTIYARLTPNYATNFGTVKLNAEGAWQQGNAMSSSANFKGYMYSFGAGADFNYTYKPSAFVGYDFYSGDSNPTGGDFKAFVSPVPSGHGFLGHYDAFNPSVANLVNGDFLTAGIQDIYAKIGVQPMDALGANFAYHYFTSDKDVKSGTKSNDNLGWETDLDTSYQYTKNLCFELGWDHFNPDKAYEYWKGTNDKSGDTVYAQATLNF